MRLAAELFEKEVDDYLRYTADVLSPQSVKAAKDRLMKNLSIPRTDVVESGKRAQLWSTIVDEYRRLYKKHRPLRKLTFGPLRVVICDGFILLKHDQLDTWRLASFEQLQMIQDCCLARHNLMLALQFQFHNGTEELRVHVSDIISWQETVLTTCGNDGFELVKAPEAIFKTWINSLTGGDLLGYSSYHRTLDKMREKQTKIGQTRDLIGELDRIVQRVDNIYDAAELFGLAKMSGHPSVYAHRSADSVRKEAEPKGTIQPFAVRQMERMFKHLTLSGYLNEHSAWPDLICPPARDTQLRRHYLNQVTTLPLGSYPLSDLDAIRFGKFVNYDYSEDYLKFLDDKAICPGATEMSKFWFDGNRKESRRLLQKILSMEHFDTVAMVERLRQGKFTSEEMVVELTQKERELKVAARCFCKLPFEVRTFFTSTEYNLKEQFMSKYMPQQTMTMSNTETKTRLYNLVKTAKRRDRTLLEVDFSRWNLRWRQETVHPISSILEDIFGLPGVFSQAHPFFEKATIVMTDKHTLPLGATPSLPVTQWPVSSLVWRGTHLGGFEGIQQALWTACTIAMMYWVLHDQNLAFNMAGQGDNQIFAITFTDDGTPPADRLRKLLSVMEVRCALLNHEVKPDECIDSQTVLTYSKDVYVEGVHILYNLKFASRSFRRDEIDIPSLSGEVAAVSAISMACADSVYETFRAVHWRTLHTLRLFSYRYKCPFTKVEHSSLGRILSEPLLSEFVLRVPGSLGGLPVMQWTRYFMKGEVDDLSWDIPAIRLSRNRLLNWDLRNVIDGKYTPTHPNLSQLVLDPHSLPLERPRDRKKMIKDAIADRILDHTKNKWIREIFSRSDNSTDLSLMETLTEARPFYPEIMSDVYSLSPSGVKDALLSRFTMTRTVAGMTGNQKFVTDIMAGNAQLLRFLLTRFDAARAMKGLPSLPNTCYGICKELRRLWGPSVEHRNVGVYNPLDFKLQFFDPAQPMISASSRADPGETLISSIGPYPPNFGTKTKQKVSDHGFKIITSSSTVSDLRRLVLIYSELGYDPSLGRVLSEITLARSPYTIDQLATVLPTSFGGTAAHRHSSINSVAFSILGSRTVPTHLNFCSDIAGKLSGGEFDYPVAFQEYYLTLTNLFQNLSSLAGLSPNAAIGFKLSDDYEELPTNSVVCDTKRRVKWSPKQDNALCYIGKMEAREVPHVPQSSQVPHIHPDLIKPAALVYNRLLSKYASRRRLFTSTSSVNLPIEVLDMKEFNHCPLSELIRGTSFFISAMAVYVAVLEFKKDASVVLNETIARISRGCSALLARMMLHPSFSTSQFALENGVISEPGISGARAAADNLTGELIHRVYDSLNGREFLSYNIPFVLFADYSTTAALPIEIHCMFKMAISSFDIRKVVLTNRQLLAIQTAKNSLLGRVNMLYRVLSVVSATNQVLRNLPKQKTVAVDAPVKLQYCNATPEEAIRSLRSLPFDARLQSTDSVNRIKALQVLSSCRIRFEYTDREGSLIPQHQCPPATYDQLEKERVLNLLFRPYHGKSSAISVWGPILARHRTLIKAKNCMSIGVGHGAVAGTALNEGCTHVYGIDLRSSFPAITQRELTYVPPEVIRSARSKSFSWSRFVSQTGGDVVRYASSLISAERPNTIILDIEQSFTDTLTVIKHLPYPCGLMVRVHCCIEQLRYMIDAIRPTAVYCTTSRIHHTGSFVLVVERLELVNGLANYERVSIESLTTWSRCCEKSTKFSLYSMNEFIRPFGHSLKLLSATEVRRVSELIKRDGLNSNDAKRQTDLLDISDNLDRGADIFLSLPKLEFDALLSLRSDIRRVVCCWIANTGFDLTETLNELKLT